MCIHLDVVSFLWIASDTVSQTSQRRIAGHVLSVMDTRVSLSVGLKHGRLGGLSTSATVVRRRKSSAGAGATTSTAIPGQPGSGHFAGGVELPVTSRLDIVDPDNFPVSAMSLSFASGGFLDLRQHTVAWGNVGFHHAYFTFHSSCSIIHVPLSISTFHLPSSIFHFFIFHFWT